MLEVLLIAFASVVTGPFLAGWLTDHLMDSPW